MRWFRHIYGSNPLHLLVTIACFALAGYAANKLLAGGDYLGILVWLGGAVLGHDLILFPLYAIADRSVMTVFRRRPPTLPAVPWINYLRVPVVFSAILLLIWFPLIFRLPKQFTADHTGLPLNPYLGRWLAVTGTLFLLSAIAYALRLRPRRGRRNAATPREAPPPQPLGGARPLPAPDNPLLAPDNRSDRFPRLRLAAVKSRLARFRARSAFRQAGGRAGSAVSGGQRQAQTGCS